MIQKKFKLTMCVLIAAWPIGIPAQEKKSLAEACPRLTIPGTNHQDGAADKPIIIDNAMVRSLAEKGRFAAITTASSSESATAAAPEAVNKNRKPSKTRDRWRAEYRREVAAVRKLALRLAIAREELQGLKDQYYHASSESQRMRLEPRLNRKKLEINDLEYSLHQQRASFSRLIREARYDGAQPGWFRDLQRP